MSPYPKIQKDPKKSCIPKTGCLQNMRKMGSPKTARKWGVFWGGFWEGFERCRNLPGAFPFASSTKKNTTLSGPAATHQNMVQNHEKHQNPHLKTNDILDTNRMWFFDVTNTRLIIISCHEVIMRCVRWRAPPNTPNGCVGLWPIKTATTNKKRSPVCLVFRIKRKRAKRDKKAQKETKTH